jgi:hypothetical protein
MALPQVAEYLRCSPSTVGRLLKKRDIPAFRLAQLPQLEGENKFPRVSPSVIHSKFGERKAKTACSGDAASARDASANLSGQILMKLHEQFAWDDI